MAGKKRKKRIHGSATADAAATPLERSDKSSVVPEQIKWRWGITLGALVALSVMILFLSWIKFFDLMGVDRYLQDLLISYVGSTESQDFDGRVALLLIDKEDQPNQPFGNPDAKHRAYHAQLIRLLNKAGAKVIVFDVEFPMSSPNDQDFAQAIKDAESAGTKIVVGAFLENGLGLPIADMLKPAIGDHWGIVDGEIPKSKSEARFVHLAAPKNSEPPTLLAEQPVFSSLALQAVRMLRYPNEEVSAWYNTLAGEVRLRSGASGKLLESVPVNSGINLLVDLPGKDEIPRRSYQNVLSHPNDFAESYKDKIVVVGYQGGDELKFLDSDMQVRYGSEYHATAISTILTGSYLRPVPILYHFLVILFLIAIAAFLQIRFSSWMTQTQTVPLPLLPAPFNKITIPTPLLVVSVIYILIIVLAFKAGHIVFDMSYHLAALILTYFLFVLCRPLFSRKVKERKP